MKRIFKLSQEGIKISQKTPIKEEEQREGEEEEKDTGEKRKLYSPQVA